LTISWSVHDNCRRWLIVRRRPSVTLPITWGPLRCKYKMSLRKVKTALSRLRALPYVYEDLRSLSKLVARLETRLECAQEALGRIELRQLSIDQGNTLAGREFRVFSQWGEDGIIQFLISQINIEEKTFVEFGVEDYAQANTRFLMVNNNWRGLVIDSDSGSIEHLRRSAVCWQFGLKAVASHVTAENINELLRSNEFNHRFGSDAAVTIPYDKDFRRGIGHPIFYFGASLKALCDLAAHKGYAFVGCNSNGVNAFFVRRDKLPIEIKELTPAEGYVAGKFSEARDEEQRFKISPPEEERRLLMNQPLVTVEGEN